MRTKPMSLNRIVVGHRWDQG